MYSCLLIYLFLLVPCVFTRTHSASDPEKDDDGRIVGGYITSITRHPHQISLQYRGKHRCGGSIICKQWVVTAAHCVQHAMTSQFRIKAGSSTLNGRGQVVRVKDVITHKNYSPFTSDSDIALLHLEQPLELSLFRAKPIDLDSDIRANLTGRKALVTGWGVLNSNGRVSNQLRAVAVPIISNDQCADLYSNNQITDNMVCAGYVGEGDHDACQGDSGGPLVQDEKLIGVVSWGIGCAHPSYPGVYTRIAPFYSWIIENTNCSCK